MTPAKRTPGGRPRGDTDEATPASGSVSVPDTGFGAQPGEYGVFIWGKLNAIEARLGELAESYGRVDTRLDTVQGSIDKIDGKVSKHESQLRWAAAVVAVTVFIVGALMALYKVLGSHLTIGWH